MTCEFRGQSRTLAQVSGLSADRIDDRQTVAYVCDRWGYGLRCATLRCPLPSAFTT
jgi:hypothetical protein